MLTEDQHHREMTEEHSKARSRSEPYRIIQDLEQSLCPQQPDARPSLHPPLYSEEYDDADINHSNPRDDDFDLTNLPLRKIFTLIFIHDQTKQRLLLGRKIRGPLTGQWNGFGGKVERGLDLSVAESAARELLEEAFLEAPLFPIGYVQWVVEPLEPATSTAHGIEAKRTGVEDIYRDIMVVYKAHSFARPSISALSSTETTASTVPCDHTTQLILEEEFLASDEMAPAWWPVSELPWDHMRINHKVWYPFLLADRIYRAVYWYKTHLSDYQEKDGQELEGSKKKSAANAQRETAKEIWVENLERRCIQFGPEVQMPGKEIRTAEEQQARLDDFAQQLGLLHAFSDGKEHPQHYCPGGSKRSNEREHKKPDPAPCESLDEKWMREAIIKAEVDWLVI